MDLYEIDENGYILEPEEIDITPESSYFIVLTTDVLYDKRLNDFQKILFGAVSGLCRKRGYCWAPNSHFEKELNKSESVVSQGISKLVELGYLNREIILKKKYDKDGKIIQTKQVAFRKLTVALNNAKKVDDRGGMPENEYTPMPKNEKQINNNIINNITISKDIDEQANCSSNETKSIPKNNELLVKLYKQNETENSDNTKVDSSSNNSSKGKGGLKPLIDLANDKFPKERYPDINSKLITYLKCHLGCRRLPTLEKWEDMLFKLEVYSSVQIPGTSGSKFLNSRAIEIIEKAIYGKNGAPYLDFDNLYGVKEPHLNSNQNFITGF